jgi:hypothetical protein
VTAAEQLRRTIEELKTLAHGLLREDYIDSARITLQTAEMVCDLTNHLSQYGLEEFELPVDTAGES